MGPTGLDTDAPMKPIAPLGLAWDPEFSQASPKHWVPPPNSALLQAIELIQGSILPLVRAFTLELLKPVVTQEVMEPWPM